MNKYRKRGLVCILATGIGILFTGVQANPIFYIIFGITLSIISQIDKIWE